MKELVIKGVEQVYDAFDEYEHANPIELRLNDISLSEAIAQGRSLLQSMVDKVRKEGGFLATGSFIAELTRIEDVNGYVLYLDSGPVDRGLRFFGGDLEDYRDVASRFVFISYSHKDEPFVCALVREIQKRGIRLWFDRDDISTEARLLRFDTTSDDETVMLKILTRVIDRAERLLLVASKNSIGSRWVETEVSLVLKEGERWKIPIDCLLIEKDILPEAPAWVSSLAEVHRLYDFSNWQDPESWGSILPTLLTEAFHYKGA